MDNFDKFLNISNIKIKAVYEELCIDIINEQINYNNCIRLNENVMNEAQESKSTKIISFIKNFFKRIWSIIQNFFKEIIKRINNIFNRDKYITEVSKYFDFPVRANKISEIIKQKIIDNTLPINKNLTYGEIYYITIDSNHKSIQDNIQMRTERALKACTDYINTIEYSIKKSSTIYKNGRNLPDDLTVSDIINNLYSQDDMATYILNNFGIPGEYTTNDLTCETLDTEFYNNYKIQIDRSNIMYYSDIIQSTINQKNDIIKNINNIYNAEKININKLKSSADTLAKQQNDIIIPQFCDFCSNTLILMSSFTKISTNMMLIGRRKAYSCFFKILTNNDKLSVLNISV